MATRTKGPTAVIDDALTAIIRNATDRRMHERVRREVPLPLERSGFVILRLVDEGTTRLSALAAALLVDVSTASRQVRALEQGGYLARAVDATDARASVLSLTERGREALAAAREARRHAYDQILAGWSAADRRTLAPLLARLADDIAAYAAS